MFMAALLPAVQIFSHSQTSSSGHSLRTYYGVACSACPEAIMLRQVGADAHQLRLYHFESNVGREVSHTLPLTQSPT
jgi:hypothetical protein